MQESRIVQHMVSPCLSHWRTSLILLLCNSLHSHLPVKGTTYQCAICSHGGHQDCYRHFFLRHPPREMPSSHAPQSRLAPQRRRSRSQTRTETSTADGEDDDTSTTVASVDSHRDVVFPVPATRKTKVLGYACAAGCGHFCWAAAEVGLVQ